MTCSTRVWQHLIHSLKVDVFEFVPLCEHHNPMGLSAGGRCICAYSDIAGPAVPPGAAHGVIPLELLHSQIIKDELLRHLHSIPFTFQDASAHD